MAKKKKRKKKGTGNLKTLLAFAVVVAAVGIAALVFFSGRFFERGEMPGGFFEVKLYFGSLEGTYLTPETVRVNKGTTEDEATEAIKALVHGSKTGLQSTIPRGTRLLSLRIEGDLAIVDMSGELASAHGGGSSGEILTVYSIVNTVAMNFGTVREVQILINGKERDTLAGHIDISFPLPPDTKLIRARKTVDS